MNPGLIVVIAAPTIALIGTVLTLIMRRKSESAASVLDQAQAAQVVQGMALNMLEPLREKIADLEAHIATLEKKIHDLTDELDSERADRQTAESERDRLKILLGTR